MKYTFRFSGATHNAPEQIAVYTRHTDADSKAAALDWLYTHHCSVTRLQMWEGYNIIELPAQKHVSRRDLINDNDFSGYMPLVGGYELITLYPGGDKLHYHLLNPNGFVIFEGKDYRPGAATNIDSIAAIVGLLGFLTTQFGDTDSDYFKDYTPAQIEWTHSRECEEIKLLIYDYENKDSEGHTDAHTHFFCNYTQYVVTALSAKPAIEDEKI